MTKFIYSGSPHVTGRRTTKGIMLDVVIALLPAAAVGCVYFGWKALLIVAISVFTAVLSEVLYRMIFNRETFKEAMRMDLSSVVTGLLIGMNLGVQVGWYVPVFASVFAIVVTKMLFGGTGRNLFNPAIAGRIFVFISFLSVMTKFDTLPGGAELMGATPLANLLTEGSAGVSNLDLFLGRGVARLHRRNLQSGSYRRRTLSRFQRRDKRTLSFDLHRGRRLVYGGFEGQLFLFSAHDFVRRSHAGRDFHGDRLRYDARHLLGQRALLCHAGFADCRLKACGGDRDGFVLYSHYESYLSVDRQVYRAPSFRNAQRKEG